MSDAVLMFGVGAPKSGTTWLHDYLAGHPDVYARPFKEYHYFDAVFPPRTPMHVELRRVMLARQKAQTPWWRRRWDAELREITELVDMHDDCRPGHAGYRACLENGRGRERVLCDITPSYARLDRDAYAAMRDLPYRTRFVFLMRDPVSRLWSECRSLAGLPSTQATAETLFRRRLDRIDTRDVCNYQRTIEEIDAAVPEDKRLILFYENLFQQDAVDRVTSLLGIQPFAGRFKRRIHGGTQSADLASDLAAKARQVLDPVYVYVKERFGAQVPAQWGASFASEAASTGAYRGEMRSHRCVESANLASASEIC